MRNWGLIHSSGLLDGRAYHASRAPVSPTGDCKPFDLLGLHVQKAPSRAPVSPTGDCKFYNPLAV